MLIIFLIILAVAVVSGGILYGINYQLAKKNGEVIASRYIKSILVLFVIYLALFSTLFVVYYLKLNQAELKITSLKENQKQLKIAQKTEIEKLRFSFGKELALAEWKNKVFNSNKDLKEALEKAKTDYKLSDIEMRNWKLIAENNTMEKLIPKNNSREVLAEFQGRLKNSLSDVKSGHTLMVSDIRMLSDNINAIRFVGKEYEKVLDSFRELYNNINANNNGADLPMPKQQKFLFFPVKQKQYNQLLQQYYESKGNAKASAEIAVKLKETIDKAEEQFKEINKKFEDNMSFLQSTSDSVTYNSDKLQKLIEAAISEANVINETDSKTNIKINNTKKD